MLIKRLWSIEWLFPEILYSWAARAVLAKACCFRRSKLISSDEKRSSRDSLSSSWKRIGKYIRCFIWVWMPSIMRINGVSNKCLKFILLNGKSNTVKQIKKWAMPDVSCKSFVKPVRKQGRKWSSWSTNTTNRSCVHYLMMIYKTFTVKCWPASIPYWKMPTAICVLCLSPV